MTRDEAIKIAEKVWFEPFPSQNVPTSLISVLEALGMLKLDEPKSLDARINYAINYEMCSNKTVQAREIKAALDRAGLKIVDKDSK